MNELNKKDMLVVRTIMGAMDLVDILYDVDESPDAVLVRKYDRTEVLKLVIDLQMKLKQD